MDKTEAETQLTPALWAEAVKLLECGYRIYVPAETGKRYTWFYYATLPEDPPQVSR